MRPIDADALRNAIEGTTMSREQRNLFNALIDKQPRIGYEEEEVSKMLEEIDYWRKHCDRYEHALIVMAVKLTEREAI